MEIAKLKREIDYCPSAFNINPNIKGAWVNDGKNEEYFVCNICLNRINQRGIYLGSRQQTVYSNSIIPKGECVCCKAV